MSERRIGPAGLDLNTTLQHMHHWPHRRPCPGIDQIDCIRCRCDVDKTHFVVEFVGIVIGSVIDNNDFTVVRLMFQSGRQGQFQSDNITTGRNHNRKVRHGPLGLH